MNLQPILSDDRVIVSEVKNHAKKRKMREADLIAKGKSNTKQIKQTVYPSASKARPPGTMCLPDRKGGFPAACSCGSPAQPPRCANGP